MTSLSFVAGPNPSVSNIASLYSIGETAKQNDIDPLAYLTHVCETLPNMFQADEASLEELLSRSTAMQTRFDRRQPNVSSIPANYHKAAVTSRWEGLTVTE